MRIAKLVHNPTAGEAEHTKKDLIELLAVKGFDARYSSTKADGWEAMSDDTELVIVAGGDGTVKKVVLEFLEKKLHEKRPIALLPSGTANNIAKTLNIAGDKEDVIESWHKNLFKKFSIGRISGLGESRFFLEAAGFGLFPKLIRDIADVPESDKDSPEKEIQLAREMMRASMDTYHPISCVLEIDGKDHSGKYLLIEIMNTRAIGPNLVLAPDAHPGDDLLELILVNEKNSDEYSAYLDKLIAGKDIACPIKPIKAKKLTLLWAGKEMHIDDKVVKLHGAEDLRVSLMGEMLDFFVTE